MTAAEIDDPVAPEPPAGAGGRMSRAGRRGRVAVSVLAVLALLYGTFWGSDDHFPFGPFKMYANANKPDGLVKSARLEAVDAEGERFKLTDESTGLRRAEIEGQMPRFREDGSRLEDVAEAYEARHPDDPELVLVEILQRQHHLVDGQPTGEVTERQIAYWVEPGFEDLADYDARKAGEAEAEGADRSAGS